jgi:hypothetical protein
VTPLAGLPRPRGGCMKFESPDPRKRHSQLFYKKSGLSACFFACFVRFYLTLVAGNVIMYFRKTTENNKTKKTKTKRKQKHKLLKEYFKVT